jgi:hypothetical protein
MVGPQKSINRPYDMHIYPKESKGTFNRDTCKPMFTVAFTIDKEST